MLQAGSKIAQVGAYDRAYPWLDQLLQVVAPRTPADTVGPRKQVRVQASFWYGLSSTYSLSGPYSEMVKSKSCADAKAINDRIARTKDALVLGARDPIVDRLRVRAALGFHHLRVRAAQGVRR